MSRGPSPPRLRDRNEDEYDGDDRAWDRDFESQRGSLEPHRGGLILSYGVVGLLACQVFGVMAWIMGANDLKAMREGRMDPAGETQTRRGMMLGIVSVVLAIIAIPIIIALMYFIIWSFGQIQW